MEHHHQKKNLNSQNLKGINKGEKLKALLLIVVLSVVGTNLYAFSGLDNDEYLYSSITHKGREALCEKCQIPPKARELKFKKPKPKKSDKT